MSKTLKIVVLAALLVGLVLIAQLMPAEKPSQVDLTTWTTTTTVP